jgi:NADH:ubiquinone oxidoreductase subunit 4 (subunit M)
VLALLTLAGFPGAAGFVGLRLFTEGAWEASRATALAGAAATVLAAASLTLLFLRTISSNAVVSASHLRRRHLLPLAALVALAVWVGLHPQPLLARLETSVARIVMRVSPEFAADVADCLKPRSPSAAAANSGLPAGMSMAEPCDDGSAAPAGR